MLIQFENDGKVLKYKRKGHDRLYVSKERRTAVALDGAHTARLSRPALRALPRLMDKHAGVREHSTEEFALNLVHDLDNLKRRRLWHPLATLALVAFDARHDGIEIASAVVGDASVHIDSLVLSSDGEPERFFDHNPPEIWPGKKYGSTHIDNSKFLGQRRSLDEIRDQGLVQSMVVSYNAAWLAVVASDGIKNQTISDVMSEAETIADVVPMIMRRTDIRDDIALGVIGRDAQTAAADIAGIPQQLRLMSDQPHLYVG
jgi:hypothetical protein